MRYGATEPEGLAVVGAVEHFAPYLITRKFVLETDHRALTFMDSSRHTNGRLARWALQLQPFEFDIRYRQWKTNGNADALPCASSDDLWSTEGVGDVREHPLTGDATIF